MPLNYAYYSILIFFLALDPVFSEKPEQQGAHQSEINGAIKWPGGDSAGACQATNIFPV